MICFVVASGKVPHPRESAHRHADLFSTWFDNHLASWYSPGLFIWAKSLLCLQIRESTRGVTSPLHRSIVRAEAMSRMSVGVKLAVGGAVLVSVLAYVAYLGASSSWQYYLTVDECAANAEQFVGRRVRVSGRVEPGSLVIRDNRSTATFLLTGTQGRLQATCQAPLPDNLAEDMDVVVEGRLENLTHLHGDKVLTRCASKYQSQ